MIKDREEWKYKYLQKMSNYAQKMSNYARDIDLKKNSVRITVSEIFIAG
jgi:hypothetical protein